MTKSKDERLEEVGRNAAASIVEMVAALECDYDRLEELRDERAALEKETELPKADKYHQPKKALKEWDKENGEELKELTEAAGECESREDAERRIQEDALSLEFRSGWMTDRSDMQAEEFCLLLTTGGPAVRIRGELDQHGEPDRAWLEVQDWGTPWTQHFDIEQDTLLAYCRCFYMGS